MTLLASEHEHHNSAHDRGLGLPTDLMAATKVHLTLTLQV